ncbi:MAG: ferredoxin, partial [Halobacteria archaeon]|nr:ferredoxin [Halobacteria archaeon]
MEEDSKKRENETEHESGLELDVVEDDCVKCGICYEEAPDAFEDRGDGVAEVKESWNEASDDDVARARAMCPTDCIEATVDVQGTEVTASDFDLVEAVADGGEEVKEGDDEGDGPSVNLEEMSEDEIKEVEEDLEELEQLRTRVKHLEDDYAEDTPTFEERKENASSSIARVTYEYFERSRYENQQIMD